MSSRSSKRPSYLPVLSPNRAYISDSLWLPKRKIPEETIKSLLTYGMGLTNAPPNIVGMDPVYGIWGETSDHLIVPREFIPVREYPRYPFKFVDLTPKSFKRVDLRFKSTLKPAQVPAVEAAEKSVGGILNLNPGKGKSVLALHRAAQLGVPTIIIVHNTTIFNQWIRDEIPRHLVLPPGETVGVVQGPTFDWKRPIVVAMIHSLAKRLKEGHLPYAFRRHFGLAVWDEVHHLSAPLFRDTSYLFLGERRGLSATPERNDNLDYIFRYHLGDIYFQDLSMDIVPHVFFQLSPVRLTDEELNSTVINGLINISKLRSLLGSHEEINDDRARHIKEDLRKGYKVFCISHSKEQCRILAKRFPGSVLLIDDTSSKKKKQEKMDRVRSSRLTFAIAQLGTEGLNDNRIDSLRWLTLHKDMVALRQSVGRLQREHEKKKQPKITMHVDVYVDPIKHMYYALRKLVQQLGLPFQNISARDV